MGPISAAQSSVRRDSAFAIAGMIANASHDAAVTKKPVARKRS
jgi:hypothetical protein